MRITRWSTQPLGSLPVRPAAAVVPIAVGDYLCSERELYRVEQIGSEHAVIEECRTGELIDTRIADLSSLGRVNRS